MLLSKTSKAGHARETVTGKVPQKGAIVWACTEMEMRQNEESREGF